MEARQLDVVAGEEAGTWCSRKRAVVGRSSSTTADPPAVGYRSKTRADRSPSAANRSVDSFIAASRGADVVSRGAANFMVAIWRRRCRGRMTP